MTILEAPETQIYCPRTIVMLAKQGVRLPNGAVSSSLPALTTLPVDADNAPFSAVRLKGKALKSNSPMVRVN